MAWTENDRPTAAELHDLPVLSVSQADNLHYESEDGRVRFWLSRCGIIDGEPFENTITIEIYIDAASSWDTHCRYDGGVLPDEEE